jgi:hypothetical protein
MDFVTQIITIFTDFWWGSQSNYEAWIVSAQNFLDTHSIGWAWPLEFIENIPYFSAILCMVFVLVFFALMIWVFCVIGKTIANRGDSRWERY